MNQENHKLNHIGFVMDGNRRWATERSLPKLLGHTEGAKTLKKIATAIHERKIPYMTVWALSTENLKNRSESELAHLFKLFGQLIEYLDDFFKKDIRCNIIGDLTKLPQDLQNKLNKVVQKTKDNKTLTLTLAINYGGRDEILRAVRKLISDKSDNATLMAGELEEGHKALTEESFKKYLDTFDLPDPELIIRTGGHQRLSGYFPWQSTYSELYFTDTYWPAFKEEDLDKAIEWYEKQQKNRGK